MMATNTYDALIVGSGITGGWAAKELTEKGLNVLVLEAGRTIVPEKDYVEHVPSWELKYRGWDERSERQETQPVQREVHYACDEYSHKFFVNDKENPYTNAAGTKFSWIRGRQVGGKSITWGRQSYRWSDLDFEANQREGVAIDWPIRYADIAPWYDHVEKFIGASGENSGLPQLPAQNLQPPFEMNALEKHIRARFTEKFNGERKLICSATAVLSRRFPDGLGNDSGELGHNLMDHHNGGGATASYSKLLDRYYRGRRSTSMYIPRFRNVARKEEKFVRGYGYEVYTNRGSWTRGV